MSTFKLISAYSDTGRKDRRVVAGTGDAAGHRPLNPNDGRALIMGEWLEHDDDYRFRRGGDNVGGTPDPTTRMAFPFFLEKGRYDAQAIAQGRATVLLLHIYEFLTDIIDTTGVAVGTPLTVIDYDLGGAGIIRRCLASQAVHAGGLVVARTVHVDATTGIVKAVRVYS
jgi:hypothetical protein